MLVDINSIKNKLDALCSIFKQNIGWLLVSGTKIDDAFLVAQFCVESYSISYRFDRTCKERGLLLCLKEGINPKQIKFKFINNEPFEGFFV